MAGPENKRNQTKRLQFIGFIRNNGTEVSFNDANWVQSENGFHRSEDPKGDTVIYEAPATTGENGRTARKIEGSVEIAASTS